MVGEMIIAIKKIDLLGDGLMSILKFSELTDDIELCNGNGAYYTVAEMKHEINNFNEDFSDWRVYGRWYIAEPAKWTPDVKWMIERYIDCEQDEMYEDWDQRIWNCFNKEDFEKIQIILDEVVKRDNGVTNYYNFGKEVEIDIVPSK